MTDYNKLVDALRYCSTTKGMVYCNVNCKYGWEEWSGGCKDLLMTDAADAIEALQAEVTRLQKEVEFSESSYDELSMQAAVQNALLAGKLPKRGEWIKHPEVKNIYGGVCIECPFCGEKYVVQYVSDEKFCRNCGADLRAKMEVQE